MAKRDTDHAADRATLYRRVRELRAALAHQRKLTEAERRRADLADERARHAWRVATQG